MKNISILIILIFIALISCNKETDKNILEDKKSEEIKCLFDEIVGKIYCQKITHTYPTGQFDDFYGFILVVSPDTLYDYRGYHQIEFSSYYNDWELTDVYVNWKGDSGMSSPYVDDFTGETLLPVPNCFITTTVSSDVITREIVECNSELDSIKVIDHNWLNGILMGSDTTIMYDMTHYSFYTDNTLDSLMNTL